jgi:hypothetical protein
MIGALGPPDIMGSNLGMGFACIHPPLVVIKAATSMSLISICFSWGSGSNDWLDFDADVELTLGGVVKHIDYPCYVFVPEGTMQCPLIVKKVNRPLVFMDARLTQEASVSPAP